MKEVLPKFNSYDEFYMFLIDKGLYNSGIIGLKTASAKGALKVLLKEYHHDVYPRQEITEEQKEVCSLIGYFPILYNYHSPTTFWKNYPARVDFFIFDREISDIFSIFGLTTFLEIMKEQYLDDSLKYYGKNKDTVV